MPEELDSKRGAGDGSVELTPLQLIRWIDTSPDLGYLRDAADRVQGRYDSTTGQITFQRPNVDTVVSQDKGFTKTLRYFFWPKANSIRGKSCASQEFDQSCGNTVNLMAVSTLWDAITTYPLIEFALTDFIPVFAFPAAIGLSLGLTAGSNIAGKESCNRTKGKRGSARTALFIFLGLSLLRTSFSGVGLDILINRAGITRGYAKELVGQRIDETALKIEELSTFQNPVLQDFKAACDATEAQLRDLQRGDLRWDSTFRKARGSFAQQEEMRGKTPAQVVEMWGSVANIPGDCNRQVIQQQLDNQAADELRDKLKVYKKDQDILSPYSFLEKHFTEDFETKFVESEEGDIEIREGGELVRTAIVQFYSKLTDLSKLPGLGFSLFGMIISIVLSGGSVLMLRSKSKSEDMQMSFSDQMLNEREDLLNGYSEKLPISQARRRNAD